MINFLLMIGGIVVFIPLIMIWASVFVLRSDFKHYKPTYELLDSMSFEKSDLRQYGNPMLLSYEDVKTGFIYWPVDESFRLNKDAYLHNAGFTYYSLYGWYWIRKYQKWFRDKGYALD